MDIEDYSNPAVQKNRTESGIAHLKCKYYDAALDEITKLQNELKYQYGRSSTSIDELKKLLEINRRHASQDIRKYDNEYDRLKQECQHDFRFEEESYTGNFDFYVCTKCGQVEMRKA